MRRFLFYPLLVLVMAGTMISVDTLWGQQTGSQAERARPGSPGGTGSAGSGTGSDGAGRVQAGNVSVELARMREDLRGLSSMVREQNLVIEELQRENRSLAQRLEEQDRRLAEAREGSRGNYATMSQINRALEEMNENFSRVVQRQRRDIIEQVTRQIDALARETERAMDSMARQVQGAQRSGSAPEPERETVSFSDDYPEEGISYTVQSGDTLSSIASRHNSTIRDIRNANRIEDPNRLRVGQTLFIPQRD